MPFENSVAHAFTAVSIRAHAPSYPGLYGISNAREWIYIDQTDNIQDSLLQHLERDSSLLTRVPTGFVFELSHSDRQHTRRERLIREYAPVCNVGRG